MGIQNNRCTFRNIESYRQRIDIIGQNDVKFFF